MLRYHGYYLNKRDKKYQERQKFTKSAVGQGPLQELEEGPHSEWAIHSSYCSSIKCTKIIKLKDKSLK